MPINGYSESLNINNPQDNLRVGDWVQIKPGAIDITNGTSTNPNSLYLENSDTWGRVERIVNNYPTNGRYNLPSKVRAVQVGNGNGVVMYTVQDVNIATNRVSVNITRNGLNTLSPLSTVINSRDQNLINSTINSLSLISGTKFSKSFTGSIEAWNKVLTYDRMASSLISYGENIYNTLAYILTGKKEEITVPSIIPKTFGSGYKIQNWIQTTNLSGRGLNQKGKALFKDNILGRALNVVNQITGIVDSVMILIGQGQPTLLSPYQTTLHNRLNLPVHATQGTISGQFDSTGFKLVGDSNGVIQTNEQTQAGKIAAIQANTVENAKLSGYKDLTQEIEETHKKIQEYKTKVSQSITQNIGRLRNLTDDEKKSIGNIDNLKIANNVQIYKFKTFAETDRKQLINDDETLVQNAYGYPVKSSLGILSDLGKITDSVLKQDSSPYKAINYDYQILIDDSTIKVPSGQSLEDQLTKFRKSVNLQVHGDRNLGRAVKYFLYNRYRMFDGWNLAFNRTYTHVFFTRPDLNLLYNGQGGENTILDDIKNHSDTFLIWQRNPNLFRLLTDCKRTGELEPNNFNLFLSQQVTNFDFKDENISTIESTKTWKDYSIRYGGSFKGRGAGSITLTFAETEDLAVYDFFRLWMIYIDNVTLGIWRPSYNLLRSTNKKDRVDTTDVNRSHIYTRTLDYAASVYAFKVAPDGENILYWTKYYGIFPTNVSASQFNWSAGDNANSPMTVQVTFDYSFKKDLSPVSLLEFNRVSGIEDDINASSTYEPNLDMQFNTIDANGNLKIPGGIRHGRPLVGCPFIAVQSISDSIKDSKTFKGLIPKKDADGNDCDFRLLLKFKPVPNKENGSSTSDPTFNYDNLYKANSTIRSVNNKSILQSVVDKITNKSSGQWVNADGTPAQGLGVAGSSVGARVGTDAIMEEASNDLGSVPDTDSLSEGNISGSVSGSVI